MIDLSIKNIGPASLAATILEWHEHAWQQKEIKWLSHLYSRQRSPVVGIAGADRDLMIVDRCPSYSSKQYGGCSPGGKYLMSILNETIERDRPYYDAEVIRRMRDCIVLALDASYKVGKWMMRHGDQKIFEALHTGMNEYGEIILQRFSTSDNHAELEEYLTLLKEFGLKPSWVFSDVPDRDRELFCRLWEELKTEDVDPMQLERIEVQFAANTGLEMIPADSGSNCIYIHNAENAAATLLQLTTDILNLDNNVDHILAFDLGTYIYAQTPIYSKSIFTKTVFASQIEWPVNISEDRRRAPGKANLILLGTYCDTKRYIIEIGSWSSSSRKRVFSLLTNLLCKEGIQVFGANHQADLTKLKNDYANDFNDQFAVENFELIDVQKMALNRGVVKRELGRTTLQALCCKAGCHIPKPKHMWYSAVFGSRKYLPEDARRYCMRDVSSLLILYKRYVELPILVHRILNEGETDMAVEIMPRDMTATAPVARGIIIPCDGPGNVTSHGIKLNTKAKRYLVQIKEVCDNNGIIHFHWVGYQKCKCGRFRHGDMRLDCDLYCFGDINKEQFNIIEAGSRLRKCVDPVAELRLKNGSTDTVNNDDNNQLEDNIDLQSQDGEKDDDSDSLPSHQSKEKEGAASNDDDSSTSSISVEYIDEFLGIEIQNGALDTEALDVVGNEDAFEYDQEPIDNYTEEVDSSPESAGVLDNLTEKIRSILEEADTFSKEAFGLNDTEFQFDAAVSDEEEPVEGSLDAPNNQVLSRVLGDAFHVMDRVKVPINHCIKPAYFMPLQEAIFVMNPVDVQNIRRCYDLDDKVWRNKVAFDFRFIAKRVRRRIPPPMILSKRLDAVYNLFENAIDFTTNRPLFNDKAKEKVKNILEMTRAGYLSDPHGVSFYVNLYNEDGTLHLDKRGLQLYRSVRGTSLVESLHELLTRSFGHTRAGARYSDNLLTKLRHNSNWRASLRNRPGFPQLRHYDGKAVDIVNDLYEECFGTLKYPEWAGINDIMLPKGVSPFGVVKDLRNVDFEGSSKKIRNNADYIASRQGTAKACLPVKGKDEYVLFCN